MSADDRLDVMESLHAADADSIARLVPLVYRELRSIAHHQLAKRSRAGLPTATLETTALVNEVYLRLAGLSQGTWRDRAHFLAIAAVAMRHLLIERARAARRAKRGGDVDTVTLCESVTSLSEDPAALLEIDHALQWLARTAPRLARVVEYRFYGGMTEEEIAAVLGVTVRTVQRDWTKARTLLRDAMEG
jgi:RNA polymerase sigma factor (TIGR02999 family)